MAHQTGFEPVNCWLEVLGKIGKQGYADTSKDNNFSKMIDFHYYHFYSNVDDRTLFSFRLWRFLDCSQYDFKSKKKNKLTFKDILVN